MRTLGVPYPEGYEEQAIADLEKQAGRITENLKLEGYEVSGDAEIVALIAYLQRLGRDVKVKEDVATGN